MPVKLGCIIYIGNNILILLKTFKSIFIWANYYLFKMSKYQERVAYDL